MSTHIYANENQIKTACYVLDKWTTKMSYDWVYDLNHKDYFLKSLSLNTHPYSRECYERGLNLLSDKLIIPRAWLITSHTPKNFSLEKTVNIPMVGLVKFTIYKSRDVRNKGKFIRVYLDCPVCNKHVPIGRFHQHATVHKTCRRWEVPR
jgi:hypothetical protein